MVELGSLAFTRTGYSLAWLDEILVMMQVLLGLNCVGNDRDFLTIALLIELLRELDIMLLRVIDLL